MKTKTFVVAVVATVAAGVLWRAHRKAKKSGAVASAQNSRDDSTQAQASRADLSIDVDPPGLA